MNGKMIQGLFLALCMQSAGVALAQAPVTAQSKTKLTWGQSVADTVSRGGRGGDWNNWHTVIFVDASNPPALVQQMLSVHVNDAAKSNGKVVLFQIRDPRDGSPETEQIYVTDEAGQKLYKALTMTTAGDGRWHPQNPADETVLRAFTAMKDYWLTSSAQREPMQGVAFDEDAAVSWEHLAGKAREEGYSSGNWNTLNIGSTQGERIVVEIFSAGVGAEAGKIILSLFEIFELNKSMFIAHTAYVTDTAGQKLSKAVKMTQNVMAGNAPQIQTLDERAPEIVSAFNARKKLWLSNVDLSSNSGVSGEYDWVFAPPTAP